MEIIHEDQDTLITYEEGSSDKCVVSFSGLGYGVGLSHWTGGKKPNLVYENQQDEFRKTLNAFEQIPHAYYVTDKGRCWYNNSSFDTIHNLLPEKIDQHGFAEVYTIGNSAGGFGAIVFSPRLPRVHAVIAFAPQSSVHPEIASFENRWPEHRERIQEWKITDAVPALADLNYQIVFGADDHRDLQHAARLSATNPRVIPGARHSVAKFLREQGILYQWVEQIINSKSTSDNKGLPVFS